MYQLLFTNDSQDFNNNNLLVVSNINYRNLECFFVTAFYKTTILVPSATRLRMSLTSSPGRTKKFEFFHWLTKNGCAAEMKITKLYASHFTSGPNGGWRALQKKAKQMATVPDRSEGIVKVSA